MISNASNPSELESVVDEVLRTGVAAEIERHGQRLQIIPVGHVGKLGRLQPHPDAVVGDPEDLVHLDWSHLIHVDLP